MNNVSEFIYNMTSWHILLFEVRTFVYLRAFRTSFRFSNTAIL